MRCTLAGPAYVARGVLVPVLREFAVERSVITALWPEAGAAIRT
jgi:hypothetical protein